MCKNAYARLRPATGPDAHLPVDTRQDEDCRRDYMLKRCQKVTDRTVRQMRRRGMFRKPVDVAIDKHLVCRYDRFAG